MFSSKMLSSNVVKINLGCIIQRKFSEVVKPSMEYHKLPRFLLNVSPQDALKKDILVDKEVQHFIVDVMRMKEGQLIRGFHEKFGEYLYNIERIHVMKKKTDVTLRYIKKIRNLDPSEDLPCVLLFAPIKKERLKLLFEKATELGVTHLIPIETQNTQYPIFLGDSKDAQAMEKFQNMLIQSTEQCERLVVPKLYPQITFKQLVSTLSSKPNIRRVDGMNQRNNIVKVEEEEVSLKLIAQLQKHVFVCKERDDDATPLLQALLGRKTQLFTSPATAAAAAAKAQEVKLMGLSKTVNNIIHSPNAPTFMLFVGPEGGFTEDEISELNGVNVAAAKSFNIVANYNAKMNATSSPAAVSNSVVNNKGNNATNSSAEKTTEKVTGAVTVTTAAAATAAATATTTVVGGGNMTAPQDKVQFVSLGSTVLRAETACMSALSVVSAVASMSRHEVKL